jgi:Tfp pilus assembly ATPase PilU
MIRKIRKINFQISNTTSQIYHCKRFFFRNFMTLVFFSIRHTLETLLHGNLIQNHINHQKVFTRNFIIIIKNNILCPLSYSYQLSRKIIEFKI